VDDQKQNYDMIIGRTFTECKEVTFIKTNDQLLFAYGMRFPYHESGIPQKNPQVYDASIMRPIENLPARSAKLVEIVVGDQQMEVMIVNDSTKEVELQQGARVGVICMNKEKPQINNDSVGQITRDKVNVGPMLMETEVCTLLELFELIPYVLCV